MSALGLTGRGADVVIWWAHSKPVRGGPRSGRICAGTCRRMHEAKCRYQFRYGSLATDHQFLKPPNPGRNLQKGACQQRNSRRDMIRLRRRTDPRSCRSAKGAGCARVGNESGEKAEKEIRQRQPYCGGTSELDRS